MTYNEIIKALECCIGDTDGKDCFGCPLYEIDDCQAHLNLAALDLINLLQAENERLSKDSKRLKKVQMQLDDAMKMYNVIKAEAYKEFAEWLKKTFPKDDFLRSTKRIAEDIDNLLKEMESDNNA